MKKTAYEAIEQYMLDCMRDSAHDKEHVYRVLYMALEIAKHEKNPDMDVLIAACLLHDIGREEQFRNPEVCHAKQGSEMAFAYLVKMGWEAEKARHAADCILTHRFRSGNPPASLEAKILFDSDKLDVAGAVGIARTLLYNGQVSEPLYSLDEYGNVSDGTNDSIPSFFHEYKLKLENIYEGFYTQWGSRLAKERQQSAASFYNSILGEIRGCYVNGRANLGGILE